MSGTPTTRLAETEAGWVEKRLWLEAELARVSREAEQLREALRPFTHFDFHATQWLTAAEGGALCDSDGNELRGVPAGVIDDLIAYTKDAKAALAAAGDGQETP